MDKTTLYLDGDAYRKLKQIAAKRKQAPAQLVREAVAEYVTRHGGAPLPKSIGAGACRRGDVSERAEDFLLGAGRQRFPGSHLRRRRFSPNQCRLS